MSLECVKAVPNMAGVEQPIVLFVYAQTNLARKQRASRSSIILCPLSGGLYVVIVLSWHVGVKMLKS